MGKIRILIVDDDVQIRKLLGDGLRLADEAYEVITVATAEAAIEEIEQSEIHLLISDMRLPNLSGLDLIAYLRARRFQVPVILITGHPDVNLQAYQKVLDITAYFYKPVRMSDLIDCVHQCLSEPATTQVG